MAELPQEEPGLLCIGMCPCCGGLQLSLPTEGGKGVTVALTHGDTMELIVRMARLADLYQKGTPYVGGMLPIDCCKERVSGTSRSQ